MATLPETAAAPATRRWSADEVLRMVEVGILGEDEKYELLEGELVPVSPQGTPHAVVMARLNGIFVRLFGPEYMVRVQSPCTIGRNSLPEPDLAVARESDDWMVDNRHPRCDETLVIVEVVVTTGADARRKSPLYASAGTPLYWMVDVPRREVRVHTSPREDGTWGRVVNVGSSETLTIPGFEPIAVSAFLANLPN